MIAAKEIVDGIRKVDAAEVKVRPQLAAIKLDRLPQYGPEELDLTSLVVRLRDLERHCNRLDGQMAECKKTVTTLTDDHARTAGSYAMATARGEAALENVQRPVKVAMAARPAYQASVTKVRLTERKRKMMPAEGERMRSSANDIPPANNTPPANDMPPANYTSPRTICHLRTACFTLPTEYRRRLTRPERQTRTTRSASAISRNTPLPTSNRFSALSDDQQSTEVTLNVVRSANSLHKVYVGKFDPETGEANIRSYVKRHVVQDQSNIAYVKKVRSQSHSAPSSCSFCVAMDSSAARKALFEKSHCLPTTRL